MLLVLLDPPSPRARYTVEHVCGRLLGWPVAFAASREEFVSSSAVRLHYGGTPIADAFHVPASGYLERVGIPAGDPPREGSGRDLRLFPGPDGVDVFAACFHLLALVEEHTLSSRDAHDRVPADDLLLVRQAAHTYPLVDLWALELAERLRSRFPELPPPQRTYRHHLTVDVDNGLKYAARSLSRAIGASAKEVFGGKRSSFAQRWRVRSGAEADPYIAFVDHLGSVRPSVDRLIAFVLTRGEGRFDHAARTDHPAFRDLLARLRDVAEIGLHPSYNSSRSPTLVPREREVLARVAGIAAPRISRQHFLRWRMPDTFRHLHELGFTEDHSIGFSDRSGFRAGTCTPFPWYDVERDAATPLVLHPFAVMDSARADRTGAGLRAALDELKRLSDSVRAVNGTFVSVWHDRFLSGDAEFADGPEVMRELVEHARA